MPHIKVYCRRDYHLGEHGEDVVTDDEKALLGNTLSALAAKAFDIGDYGGELTERDVDLFFVDSGRFDRMSTDVAVVVEATAYPLRVILREAIERQLLEMVNVCLQPNRTAYVWLRPQHDAVFDQFTKGKYDPRLRDAPNARTFTVTNLINKNWVSLYTTRAGAVHWVLREMRQAGLKAGAPMVGPSFVFFPDDWATTAGPISVGYRLSEDFPEDVWHWRIEEATSDEP